MTTTSSEYSAVLALLDETARPASASYRWTGASAEQLDRLASQFGAALPDELKTWLELCNGVRAGLGGIYGANAEDDIRNINAVLDLFPEWRELAWLPVAGDGTGNHYVIDTTRKHLASGAVYFVDAAEDTRTLAFIVASDLPKFLEFLLLQDLGDELWPFDEPYVRAKDPGVLGVEPDRLLPWNAAT